MFEYFYVLMYLPESGELPAELSANISPRFAYLTPVAADGKLFSSQHDNHKDYLIR